MERKNKYFHYKSLKNRYCISAWQYLKIVNEKNCPLYVPDKFLYNWLR